MLAHHMAVQWCKYREAHMYIFAGYVMVLADTSLNGHVDDMYIHGMLYLSVFYFSRNKIGLECFYHEMILSMFSTISWFNRKVLYYYYLLIHVANSTFHGSRHRMVSFESNL